jgi:hypothetical protein
VAVSIVESDLGVVGRQIEDFSVGHGEMNPVRDTGIDEYVDATAARGHAGFAER